MTDEERRTEGMAEAIEDLEAPAAEQADVAGGAIACIDGTCQGDSVVSVFCKTSASCRATKKTCALDTSAVVLSEAGTPE